MSELTSRSFIEIEFGDGPIVATAIHHGHVLRDEIRPLIALSEAERLREEDPFTAGWTRVATTSLVACRSRFEVDLNRPRDEAIYLRPDQAWDLHVWKSPLAKDVVERSLFQYDSFYALLHTILSRLVKRHERVVVLDLHTYNHRRDGADCPPTDPRESPDVNVGTGTMDRDRWATLVDRFMGDLACCDPACCDQLGRTLDVRENICFQGGNMSRWIHATFPESVCSLSVEFKKFFMDEWTGTVDERQLAAIQQALAATIPGLLRELQSAA